MQKSLVITLLSTLGLCAAAHADLPSEFEADSSYVSRSHTDFHGLRKGGNGDVSEESSSIRYVLTPQVADGYFLRLGAEWQRYSFGLPSKAPIPNTLESTSLVLGVDITKFDGWIFRAEATPGFYGDFQGKISDQFNVPVVFGASYIVTSELQWVVGLYLDVNGHIPLIPGVGVRWQFADDWTLDAILPTPRLEYELSKNLTIYTGFEVKDGSYRVNSHFGDSHGNEQLNGAVIDYTEFRAGAGASWKLNTNITLEFETGYMPYREFSYHRVGSTIDTHDGAPYGQISISGRF